ncbi:MAG: cell division protein SepF [Acutalibacteraceae bacterium]
MGMIDKLKNFMSVQDDDVYDDVDYAANDNPYAEEEAPASRRSSRDIYSDRDSDYSSSYDRDYSSQRASRDDSKRNKYVNIHATTQLQVVLVKPESFQDATSIADHLNQKRTVVLNLESTNKEISRRLVDFLSGVAYANQGQLKRVANSTFIVTPFNVDIMGDLLLDELENSGLYL